MAVPLGARVVAEGRRREDGVRYPLDLPQLEGGLPLELGDAREAAAAVGLIFDREGRVPLGRHEGRHRRLVVALVLVHFT